MKFDWRNFTEEKYNKYMANPSYFDDYMGAVYVGDICIDLLIYGEENTIAYDFYVAHEDTGYGYKNNTLPYDYANGGVMEIPNGLSYDEFKTKAEKMFEEFIVKYNECHEYNVEHDQFVDYSLVEHANRPLEIW